MQEIVIIFLEYSRNQPGFQALNSTLFVISFSVSVSVGED